MYSAFVGRWRKGHADLYIDKLFKVFLNIIWAFYYIVGAEQLIEDFNRPLEDLEEFLDDISLVDDQTFASNFNNANIVAKNWLLIGKRILSCDVAFSVKFLIFTTDTPLFIINLR